MGPDGVEETPVQSHPRERLWKFRVGPNLAVSPLQSQLGCTSQCADSAPAGLTRGLEGFFHLLAMCVSFRTVT